MTNANQGGPSAHAPSTSGSQWGAREKRLSPIVAAKIPAATAVRTRARADLRRRITRYATIPAITTEFKEWPLGNEAEYSYGGTASARSGLVLPTSSFPAKVIRSEPS